MRGKAVTARYQPANATEGAFFIDRWCAHCEMQNQSDDEDGITCDILFHTMFYRVDEEEYPDEWIIDEDLGPLCTAFKGIPGRRCENTLDMFGDE